MVSFRFPSAGTSPPKRRYAVEISSCARAKPGLRSIALEQLPADHHLLDLGGALADQEQRRVAVDALDLVFLGVAVAAVDAQRLLGVRVRGLRGEQLGHACLEIRPLAGVL